MLVLDKSRAIDEMLWLSQRARNAVPQPYQRPALPDAVTTPDGARRLASELVLRPAAATRRESPVELPPPQSHEPIAA